MVKRFHIINSILLALCLVLVPSYVLANSSESTTSGSGDYCVNRPTISKPEVGSIVSGVARLSAYISGGSSNVSEVRFFSSDTPLGTASTTNYSQWNLDWDSTLVANGDRELIASVKYPNGQICHSEPVHIAVQNQSSQTSTASLSLKINSPRWEGPTNVNYTFELEAILKKSGQPDTPVTDKTSFNYSTTIGSLQPNANRVKFSSGARSGSGTVTVVASFSGQQKTIKIPVSVYQVSDNSSTYPSGTSTTTTTNSTSTDSQEPETTPQNSQTDDQTAGDPILEACLLETFGSERYESLTQKQQRLLFAELRQNFECFSERRFVIPSNLAPIDPTKVKDLPQTEDAKIERAENTAVVQDDTTKEAIIFSGVSSPNQSILLYIFSEPLVLATVSDGNGNWSYTLEEPLEPGSHEVYVAVEDETGIARKSAPFFIEVAAAEENPENPLGASLELVTIADQPSGTLNYVAIATVIVVLAFGFLTGYIIAHKKHKPPKQDKPVQANGVS